MSSATRSALMITRQHFPHLGLELPAGLMADLAEIDRVFANRDVFDSSRRSLAEAVANAMAAGKDPAADKTVISCLAREQMRLMNVGNELSDLAEDRRADALRSHVDAIFELLSGTVERADETLAEVRERIPGLDLKDEDIVRTLAPEQMALWGRAREALAHVERVAQIWGLLVFACGLGALPPHRRPLVIAELSLSELNALGHQPVATAAVHAGHRLSLATPDTFAERLARLEDDRNYEASQGERDFAAAARLRYGSGAALVV
ncbi:MAG: hypothetical protein Q7J48_20560 [Nocardioides sp.]|nr:hypothetical protein [Nocardioides sp.]